MADGSPFEHRNLIIFLTFCVIFVTLVLQGLTLPFFIERLGLASKGGDYEEEIRARQKILGVALESMQAMRATQSPDEQKVLADLMRIYRRRQLSLKGKAAHAENDDNAWRWRHYRQLVRQVRGVERAEILKMRDGNEVSDEVLRRLERELDLQDLRFSEEES
jgi:CPA1 family monovalent cation:H+ antiporter